MFKGNANCILINKENNTDKKPANRPNNRYKKPILLWLVVQNQFINKFFISVNIENLLNKSNTIL